MKYLLVVLCALGLTGVGTWAVITDHAPLIGHGATTGTGTRSIHMYTASELAHLLHRDRRAWEGRTVWVRGVLEGLRLCALSCGPLEWDIYTPMTHPDGPQQITLSAGPRTFPTRDRDRILPYHIHLLSTLRCPPAAVGSGSCPDAALVA